MDELLLAHPLKTRLIAEARLKTDSIDSETLAHLLRAALIPQAYAPSAETRDQKNFLRYRSSLTAMKVRIKNMVHYRTLTCACKARLDDWYKVQYGMTVRRYIFID